jgi:hypothetical protein
MIDRILKTMDKTFIVPVLHIMVRLHRAKAGELAIPCLQHSRSAIYICNFCSLSCLERESGGALNPEEKIYAYLPC